MPFNKDVIKVTNEDHYHDGKRVRGTFDFTIAASAAYTSDGLTFDLEDADWFPPGVAPPHYVVAENARYGNIYRAIAEKKTAGNKLYIYVEQSDGTMAGVTVASSNAYSQRLEGSVQWVAKTKVTSV